MYDQLCRRIAFLCALFILLANFTSFGLRSSLAQDSRYDPLQVSSSGKIQTRDETIEESNRKVPIRIYLPAGIDQSKIDQRHPVLLFSHGLGGSREAAPYLGNHWAGRGYVCVFLQHPGSDTSAWQDAPLGQRKAVLREAASAKNFMSRIEDVKLILDSIEKWDKDPKHFLSGKIDLSKIGMSGHSFGAVTTQSVSGQSYPLVGARYTDARIRAAMPFSPSLPRQGDPKQAFSKVGIPWMLMTGTNDENPIEKTDPATRAMVFGALPPTTDHYQIVLKDATHGAFADGRGVINRSESADRYHKVILALSTAFWDAYLKDDSSAKEWLRSDSVRKILIQEDRWEVVVAN